MLKSIHSSWRHLPSPSKLSLRTSWTASSVASSVCSLHVSPLSLRKTMISRSFPRRAAKCGTSIITGLSRSFYIISREFLVKFLHPIDLPEELGGRRSQFQDAAGQSLAFHQRRRVDQFVLLQVATGDPHRAGGLARRDDDTDATVATSAHSPAASVHHKTDQEPGKCPPDPKQTNKKGEIVKNQRSNPYCGVWCRWR